MNLIICTTPLQVLIAEKIINLHPDKSFYGLFLARNKNDKYNYYYKRLEKHCIKSDFFLLDNRFRRLYSLMLLKIKSASLFRFDTVFLASIDGFFNHIVLSFVKFDKLNTFDDGLANITEDGLYSIVKKDSLILKIVKKIFQIKYSMDYIKKHTLRHYSIYNHQKNITDKLEYVRLLDINTVSNNADTVKIFVGQPLDEINITEGQLLEVFRSNSIDFYFPHPREKNKIEGINYIKTKKIFEEYVLDIITNQHCNIEMFTFFSSVALNLKEIEQIKIVALFSENIPSKFSKAYDIFKRNNIKYMII